MGAGDLDSLSVEQLKERLKSAQSEQKQLQKELTTFGKFAGGLLGDELSEPGQAKRVLKGSDKQALIGSI